MGSVAHATLSHFRCGDWGGPAARDGLRSGEWAVAGACAAAVTRAADPTNSLPPARFLHPPADSALSRHFDEEVLAKLSATVFFHQSSIVGRLMRDRQTLDDTCVGS